MSDTIEALEELLSRATPGPWLYVEDHGSRVVADGHGFSAPYRLPHGSGTDPQQSADNALIATMRNELPALLAELRRLRLTEQERNAALRRCGELQASEDALLRLTDLLDAKPYQNSVLTVFQIRAALNPPAIPDSSPKVTP